MVTLRRRAVARPLPGDLGARRPVQRRPRRRQRRARARRRPGAGADDLALPGAIRVQLAARRWAPPSPRARWRPAALARSGAGRRGAGAAGASAAGARSWLASAQNGDGGFGASPGELVEPRDDRLGDARARGARGATRSTSRATGGPPVDYLRANADRLRSTGDLERTVLALAGAGVNSAQLRRRSTSWRSCARRARLRRLLRGPGQPDRFGILALRAAGDSARAVRPTRPRWLRGAQNGDGGWGFQPAAPSDPDSTGAALAGARAAAGGRVQRSAAARLSAPRPAGRRRLRARRRRRRPTPSRRPGRSRAWSRPAIDPARLVSSGPVAGRLPGSPARPATATTATRRRATRRRSG